MHEMLEDLPEIFERKFRQRLHGILEQQQLLLSDNQALHERLRALQPADSDPEPRTPLLLPAATDGAAAPESRPEPAASTGPSAAASRSPQSLASQAATTPAATTEPATAEPATAEPATGGEPAAAEPAARPQPGGSRRRRLGSLLLGVLRLGRSRRRPAHRPSEQLSDSSDERPTAA